MILSDSFRALLGEIDTPLSKAVLRKERYFLSRQRYAIYQRIYPISIGFTFNYEMPSQVNLFTRRLKRYAPKKEIGSYFTFREKAGLISYCPAGREQKTTFSGSWARDGRQEIKPGKWIKSVLPEKMIRRLGGDPAVAQFAAKFAAFESGEGYTIEPASWDVYKPSFYGCTSKEETDSKICPSCMWGAPVADFYSKTGAVPYVIRNEGRPVGRFVFWPEASKHGNTISLVDRIYAKPSATEAVLAWATRNGHYRKEKQALDCRVAIGPDGSEIDLRGYSVTTAEFISPGNVFCPYMDTFSVGECDSDGDVTALRCGHERDGEYLFKSTNGEFNGGPDLHDGEVQDVDGEWIDEDEAVYVDGDYYHHDDERIVYCDHGSREGDHILRADAYAIELGGRLGTVYVHEDDVSRA